MVGLTFWLLAAGVIYLSLQLGDKEK